MGVVGKIFRRPTRIAFDFQTALPQRLPQGSTPEARCQRDHHPPDIVRAIEQLIVTNAVDLAITTNASLDTQIVSEQFFAAEVAAVVAAGSPLSGPRTITLKELSAIPMITKVRRRICNQIEQQLDLRSESLAPV
jgi:hypothetical protein